ncbi:uncharacterized protein LOC131663345 [Phymastichus coffea]|uniref:uncharacterized protein LOC131663345 n=1 Tax=Phymastichus coffea TaxID=108790 RepID=UPI00273AD1C1|nr:uncharacterized protein LOC131663345 [Phymastichus coffea]
MTGTKKIHTTPYHPQSNGLVECLHRTLKAALMYDGSAPWPDRLPLVLLGLHACYKEDLEASPAELLFGTTLRIPGEFFVEQSFPENPPAFVARLRAVMSQLRAVSASRHSIYRPFVHKDLKACSHVFQRIDLVNGQEKTVSTDALKPAYLEEENLEPQQPLPLSQLLPPQALSHQRPFEPEHQEDASPS